MPASTDELGHQRTPMKTMSLMENKRPIKGELGIDSPVADRLELRRPGHAARYSSRNSAPKARTILVPLDLTETSRTVLDYALWLAEDWNASIVLLHVVERMYAEAFLDTPAKCSLRTEVHRRAQEQLDALAKPKLRRFVPIRRVVRHGAPEYEILRLAEKMDADMIVLGRRRRNSLSRLILGSVTHDVVDAAPCPVVVVPAARGGNRRFVSFLEGEHQASEKQ